jgi:hypothetical protein
VYYWGAVAVVSDKAGNFYAVWEGAFGTDAEISFAWSKTGKDFSAPIELVSTSTNGQDPALWVPASGEVHAAWRGHHAFEPWYDPYYAFNGSVFSGGSFSPGVLVHADAEQDDQVAIGGDSMGNLYLAWQTFDGDIFIARSTDEGKTWSAPKKVNDETGKANVGIIPASFFKEGNVGVMSRSGTLTYQIGNELAQKGFGNSSIVGLGGDPIPGTSFVDVLEMFENDDQTELIVMSGEIGGDAEEVAAEYIAEHVTKPVVGYIAGFTAPPGKTMGHAGAIVSGSKGTAAAKAEALEAKGVRVGRTPTQVAEIAIEILGG